MVKIYIIFTTNLWSLTFKLHVCFISFVCFCLFPIICVKCPMLNVNYIGLLLLFLFLFWFKSILKTCVTFTDLIKVFCSLKLTCSFFSHFILTHRNYLNCGRKKKELTAHCSVTFQFSWKKKDIWFGLQETSNQIMEKAGVLSWLHHITTCEDLHLDIFLENAALIMFEMEQRMSTHTYTTSNYLSTL